MFISNGDGSNNPPPVCFCAKLLQTWSGSLMISFIHQSPLFLDTHLIFHHYLDTSTLYSETELTNSHPLLHAQKVNSTLAVSNQVNYAHSHHQSTHVQIHHQSTMHGATTNWLHTVPPTVDLCTEPPPLNYTGSHHWSTVWSQHQLTMHGATNSRLCAEPPPTDYAWSHHQLTMHGASTLDCVS